MEGTCQHDIAHMERTVLHEQRSHVSASLVQRRLNDRSFRTTFGVRLKVEQLGFQQHLLQQFINTRSFLCGNLLALVFTAPVFDEDVHVTQLLTNLIGVSTGFIHFVDSKHHRYARRLRVVDGLNRLWHDSIVGSDDDDGDIRHFRTTCTHSGKRSVTRGIEERDMLSVLQFDVISTDMLGDTTCLTGDDVRITDVVQERSFAVVNVTHDGDDRATRLHVFIVDHLVGINLLHHFSRYILGRKTELFGHEVDGLGIETLVDGNE